MQMPEDEKNGAALSGKLAAPSETPTVKKESAMNAGHAYTPNSGENQPASINEQGEALASSLAIAKGMGNPHASIIRLIRDNMADLQEFGRVVFEIMPFDMAGELRTKVSASTACLNGPVALRGLLLDNIEKVIALEAQVAESKPAQGVLQRIALAKGSICMTNGAKTLQIQPKKFFSFLSSNEWIYRRAGGGHWIAYQDKIQKGYLEHKVTEVTRSDGTTKITEQVLITAKGLVKLAEMLGRS